VRRRRSKSSRLICNIDVSALASVLVAVLWLLMLTEPPQDGVSADLPKVEHPVFMPRARSEDAMVLVIMRDGMTYLGNHRTTPGSLPADIRDLLSHGAENRVYIKADARLGYGTGSGRTACRWFHRSRKSEFFGRSASPVSTYSDEYA
jgi:biopolymer transport protein ExbD